MGARSHLWHCFSGLSVPLKSRYVAMIRDMPVAGDVAVHVDSSSTQSRGLLLYHCVSLRVWVLVVYTCSFGLSVSGFVARES